MTKDLFAAIVTFGAIVCALMLILVSSARNERNDRACIEKSGYPCAVMVERLRAWR